MRILLIGGSGFLSGTLARQACAAGHEVTVVTRGLRPLPDGVRPIAVDRHDRAAFSAAIGKESGGWDLVVDVICFEPDDMKQNIDVLASRTRSFVFISTDFVYSPRRRRFPQRVNDAEYTDIGYGAQKRRCEQLLETSAPADLKWTVFRPNHIYGPGSKLGCLPEHGRDERLIERLRSGEPLRLVGGGHFLQQPIYAEDLARLVLSVPEAGTAGRIFNACGPDTVESRRYYEIIAEHLGTGIRIDETAVQTYLERHPDKAPFLCHRVYDHRELAAAGLYVPDTPIEVGLRRHLDAILAENNPN